MEFSLLVVSCHGWWAVTEPRCCRIFWLSIRLLRGPLSTASHRQFENKVPEKQNLFQEDNRIPVHLKGGIADALLYRATMILTVGGMAYVMYDLAVASFHKKQD